MYVYVLYMCVCIYGVCDMGAYIYVSVVCASVYSHVCTCVRCVYMGLKRLSSGGCLPFVYVFEIGSPAGLEFTK